MIASIMANFLGWIEKREGTGSVLWSPVIYSLIRTIVLNIHGFLVKQTKINQRISHHTARKMKKKELDNEISSLKKKWIECGKPKRLTNLLSCSHRQ